MYKNKKSALINLAVMIWVGALSPPSLGLTASHMPESVLYLQTFYLFFVLKQGLINNLG